MTDKGCFRLCAGVFVYNLNGVSLAIGNGNAGKMTDKNLLEMRDADGVNLIKGLGGGWFDSRWPNPVNNAVEAKSGFVPRVDDCLIGAGIYKQ